MKNCEEMVNDLLQRRDQYERRRSNRSKMLVRTLTPVCCLALVLLLGFGAWQGSPVPTPTAPPLTLGGVEPVAGNPHTPQDPMTPDSTEPVTGRPTQPENRDTVLVHDLETLSPPEYCMFNLKLEDFEQMDEQALAKYYGSDLFTKVPEGLEKKPGQTWGIYRRGGEVYWDVNTLEYASADGSKLLAVHTAGDGKVFDLFGFIGEGQKSRIGEVEVAMGKTAAGEFQAEFLYGGIAVRLWATGMTQEEFTAAIAALTQ